MEIQIIHAEGFYQIILNKKFYGAFETKVQALAQARYIVATLLDKEIQNERATAE